MISKSVCVCACQISSPLNGLCPDSFCVNLRLIFVVPVKSGVSLLLRQGKMPQTVLIYMQILLHSPMPANSALLPGKMMGPKWSLWLKGPTNLDVMFSNPCLHSAVQRDAVANQCENSSFFFYFFLEIVVTIFHSGIL